MTLHFVIYVAHLSSVKHSVAGFPSPLHFEHALARRLHKGSQEDISRRPGLPLELVIIILRYAGMVTRHQDSRRLDPAWSFRTPRDHVAVVAGNDGDEPARRLVLVTPPLDRVWLSKTAVLQVVTESKDQGWPL